MCFTACDKDKPDDGIPKFDTASLTDWQNYTIIYPDGADVLISDAFVRFGEKIKEEYGVNMKVNTDFVIPSQPVPTDTLEILIGETNRAESISAASEIRAKDYIIRLDGNRLVITGGDAQSTAEAVDFYMAHLFGEDGLLFPTDDGVRINGEYVVDKLTIGGVDISEFTIVRGANMSALERQLFSLVEEKIAGVCGVKIPSVMYSEPETEYEILFGNTGREASSFDIPAGSASTRQTETKLAFYGNGENGNGAMIKYFIVDILSSIPKGESYDITLPAMNAVPYSSPTLTATNLPVAISDYTEAYNPDFTDNANVMARFNLSVSELPTEVTVLDRFELENYPNSSAEVYVAPDGNDNNAGTIDAPLATLYAAAKKIAPYNGGIIWVRGGAYDTSKAIDVSVSGTIMSPVFIKAYGDETPVFSSGKVLSPSAFKPIEADDAVAAKLPESAKASVVYVNLPALGWSENEIGEISSKGVPKLYIDGELQSIARYPNVDQPILYFEKVFDTGSVTSRDGSNLYEGWIKRVAAGEFDSRKDEIYTDAYGNKNIDHGWSIQMIDLTPCSWENTGDIWYYGNTFEGWESGYHNIASFDAVERKMTSKNGTANGAKHSTNSPEGHNTYYLFNAIEALDAPGEWFYDRNTGNMYIYKTEGFESADITYSAVEKTVLTFSRCNNVVIDGLTVRISEKYGIYLDGCDSVVVQGCTVSDAKNCIVLGSSSVNCAIIYNDVSGATGAMISASQSAGFQSMTPTGNIVQNNYCHDAIGADLGIAVGGYRTVASHNYLENCKINLSDSAECIIEYNDLSGGSDDVSDGGLVYLNGYYNLGNHIRYNYMHNWNASGSGVYLDDLAYCNYAYFNIIDSTEGTRDKGINMLYTSSGHYNVFFGNILVGRSSDYIHESCLYFDNTSALGYRFEGLSQTYVDTVSKYSDAVFARFPEVREYLNKMTQHVSERTSKNYVRNELEIYLRAPSNNIIKNNIILGCNVPIYQPILTLRNSVTNQPMASTDLVENNFKFKSPELILTDFENGDFTVLPDVINEVKNTIPDFYQLTTVVIGLTYER